MSETFKEGICRRLGWSPEQYEEKLFWKGLYFHAKIPALLLWSQRATVFAPSAQTPPSGVTASSLAATSRL